MKVYLKIYLCIKDVVEGAYFLKHCTYDYYDNIFLNDMASDRVRGDDEPKN